MLCVCVRESVLCVCERESVLLCVCERESVAHKIDIKCINARFSNNSW